MWEKLKVKKGSGENEMVKTMPCEGNSYQRAQ